MTIMNGNLKSWVSKVTLLMRLIDFVHDIVYSTLWYNIRDHLKLA